MNWILMVIVGILGAALIVFLIKRNKKDRKKFEKELKEDYTKPRDDSGDIDIDTITKEMH